MCEPAVIFMHSCPSILMSLVCLISVNGVLGSPCGGLLSGCVCVCVCFLIGRVCSVL